MSEKKRQHPIAIFTSFVITIKNLIIPMLLPFIAGFTEGANIVDIWSNPILLFASVIVPFLTLIHSFLHWFFFSYLYSDGVLNVYYGILVKKHKQIKRERVQTVSVKAGLIFRLFNLVSLSIETAGGKAEPEFKIAALSHTEAESLKRMLKENDRIQSDNIDAAFAAQNINPKYEITFPELFVAALTSGDIWSIFALLSFLYTEISTFIPYESIEVIAKDFLDIFIAADVILIIIGIFMVLILTVLVSTIKYMLGYANFSVVRNGDEILITRGLIEKKQIAFKLHRIQAVTVVEGLLRQPFGFCELRVNVVGDISTQQNVTPKIHPFIKSAELQDFLDKILPGYELHKELNKLPKRSLRRYIIRGVVPFLLLAPAFFFIPYGFLGILIYPPLALLAVMRYHDAGYFIKDSFITLRFRLIARTTALLSKNHIQSINLNTNYLQKRKDLKTIAAVTLSAPAAVAFTVKDISADCGKIIWNWFSWKGHVSKDISQTE